jgi:hypothetical protein
MQELSHMSHNLSTVQKRASVAMVGEGHEGDVRNQAARCMNTGVGGIRLPHHEQTRDGQCREDIVESQGRFPLDTLGDERLQVVGQEPLTHGWRHGRVHFLDRRHSFWPLPERRNPVVKGRMVLRRSARPQHDQGMQPFGRICGTGKAVLATHRKAKVGPTRGNVR